MTSGTPIRLRGVRLRGGGTIGDVFLELSEGLTVLYGTNGAGKTQILNGILEAMGHRELDSGTGQGDVLRELVFQCSELGEEIEASATGRANAWMDLLSGLRNDSRRRHGSLGDTGLTHNGRTWALAPHDGEASSRPVVDQVTDSLAWFIATTHDWDDKERVYGAAIEAIEERTFSVVRNGTSTHLGICRARDELAAETRSILTELREHQRAFGSAETLHDRSLPPAWTLDEFSSCAHWLGWESIATMYWQTDVTAPDPNRFPVWWADTLIETDVDADWAVPIEVVVESGIDSDIDELTEEWLLTRCGDLKPAPARQSIFSELRVAAGMTPPLRELTRGLLLTKQPSGGYKVDDDAWHLLQLLVDEANRLISHFLPGAPQLDAALSDVPKWSGRPVVTWYAAVSDQIRLDLLSRVERRWAVLAIRLAMATLRGHQTLVVIDEPEYALHRRAERHLADGLAWLASLPGFTVVVATHSPALLRHPATQVVLVKRPPQAVGETTVVPVAGQVRERAAELGLDAADFLQLTRAVLLVEGQHDAVVFESLFKDQLEQLGVLMLRMSGAKSLKAWDYQMIEQFTDVKVLVVLDNDAGGQIRQLWNEAVTARVNGEPFEECTRIMSGISKVKTGEAGYLHQLGLELLKTGSIDRVVLHTMSKADISEYFDVRQFVKGAPSGATWSSLRDEAPKDTDFKKWLRKYGAIFSDEKFQRAVNSLESIHPDFVEVLNHLEVITGTRRPDRAGEGLT